MATHRRQARRQYACVIEMNGKEWYSSFFTNATDAIVYAERHNGVIRVDEARYDKDRVTIWDRAINGVDA